LGSSGDPGFDSVGSGLARFRPNVSIFRFLLPQNFFPELRIILTDDWLAWTSLYKKMEGSGSQQLVESVFGSPITSLDTYND
jgi:hypothetical protein